MDKKKTIFCIIKSFSEADRVSYRQKIKNGKTSKNAERHEKLFSFFEKAIELDRIDEIKTPKLVKALKLPSAKRLTPLYAELIKDLKQFLIASELEQEELFLQLLLQKALCKRKETQYIQVLHQEIRKQISNIKDPSPEDYQLQASFYKSLYIHPNTNARDSEALLYLKLSEVNLDTSYWIRKLRLLVERANRGIVLTDESYLLEELVALPNMSQYTYNNDTHLLSIYSRVYQFALAPFQKEELEQVLTLIKEHSPKIPKEDKERIFNYLMGIISYYIPTQKTNLSFYNTFQVYKLAFTNLWLVQDDGFIYFEDFINILFAAFCFKETELLESIALDYTQYIPLGYQPYISMLSKGYNYFLHKKWDAVLKAFSNQDLPNKEHRLHFIVQRNTIELKSLFEALVHDKIELVDIPAYLEKHSRFMKRKSNSYSNQVRVRNLNFIKIIKRLYIYLTKRNSFNFDKEEARSMIKKWLAEIEKTGVNTIELPWLKSIGQTLFEEVQEPSKHSTH